MSEWLDENGVSEMPDNYGKPNRIGISIPPYNVEMLDTGVISINDGENSQRFENMSQFARAMPQLCGHVMLILCAEGVMSVNGLAPFAQPDESPPEATETPEEVSPEATKTKKFDVRQAGLDLWANGGYLMFTVFTAILFCSATLGLVTGFGVVVKELLKFWGK